MNSSNYRFTLDMQSNQSQVALPVRLNDTNRELNIILTNGGTPFIMEDGSSAVFSAKKYNGHELLNNCEIKDNSVIHYAFTEQTTNVAGVVDCELRVYDAQGKLITSPRFILVVDERVVYDEEILSRYEGTALDYILGSESARQFAEADRILAEQNRVNAETSRVSAEASRVVAESARAEAEETRALSETFRVHNEGVRSQNEEQREAAEREREQASATMTSMFNIIIGKNNSYDVSSLGAVPNYILNNLDNFAEGDVIVIANNDFDLVCMGSATEEEMNTIGYYEQADIIFGDITIEAGGTYIFVDGSSRKFLATTEKFKLPIGQEELDAHNESAEAHADIREAIRGETEHINAQLQSLSQYTDEQISNSVDEAKEREAVLEQNLKNSSANSIKGIATGEVVRVDDVSPNEHTIKCKVRSKNLYDNLSNYKNGTYTYSNGTLTVTDRYIHKFIELEEGKTYTFSCKSTRTGEDGGGVHIRAYKADQKTYVDIPGGSIINILSPTFTLTMPKGYPYIRIALYGHATSDGTGTATYTELMLEKDTKATGYVPYVDPATATVARYGKNLLDLSRATFSSATYNKDVNGITCKINNSYYSGVRIDYLNDFLLANKGKTLTFSIEEGIDDALITLLIYGTRTSGRTNQEGSTTGAREISFAISDEFTEITGLEARVNRKTTAFTDTTTVVRNMQVEVSDSATDYEGYKEATTHTPSADGTVEGIKSVAPTMTLFTDTENVVIEIEYNQDINVLNTKLNEALDAIIAIQNALMGGTVQ